MHIIAGKFKNRILNAPKSALTRPTSSRLRETLFNICQGKVEDAHFLDLFAGSGAIGLEALSRGAKKSTLVDSSRESTLCIAQNIEKLQVQACTTVMCCDVFLAVKKLIKSGVQFDLIYADPPYQEKGMFDGQLRSYSQQLLIILDEYSLLKENGLFFIEDVPSESTEKLDLQSLHLVTSRRAGKAHLNEYRKSFPILNVEG
ncbi:MAG: 16S rRNA (guanine(966)-N(2))-methyltransferase RsmD [Parachlamydiaceae bacterium]|nr:16S rRNA (guanine(966)-N(2))-methyltransferase RsmD [Parachlamydiaceae bacterium]